jgi:hypothetical protein
MTSLKLLALDPEDLSVVSTHMQDSVFRVGDIDYTPRAKQFALEVNRFAWEQAAAGAKTFERRRALLLFKRVNAVRSVGFDRAKPDEVLSLLAIRFAQNGEGPDGTLELTLSGKATIALDVECIEAQLADTGGAWETAHKPAHKDA